MYVVYIRHFRFMFGDSVRSMLPCPKIEAAPTFVHTTCSILTSDASSTPASFTLPQSAFSRLVGTSGEQFRAPGDSSVGNVQVFVCIADQAPLVNIFVPALQPFKTSDLANAKLCRAERVHPRLQNRGALQGQVLTSRGQA